ncbi:MAG TPA: hypothetical protein VHE55_09265 [Fimbriimonadaceae bacterium]|nr:hypothetical protein [Fimbriimonadaceae bacterium]
MAHARIGLTMFMRAQNRGASSEFDKAAVSAPRDPIVAYYRG